MLRNKKSQKAVFPAIKLLSLSALALLQAACGGGDGGSEAAAIGIQDVSIAYIKRPTPRDNNGDLITNDMREPSAFTEGGDLYIQARASTAATTINVTNGITNGLGDVRDVSVSYDGTKLVFSLHIEDDNMDPPETWNLYEYDIISGSLTALIAANNQEAGDDITPQYLPDGRIIFSSTRQTISNGIRTNEGRGSFTATDENRNNPAFLLHVLNVATGDIKQVSFNGSHDIDPIVLQESGRILFSRWNNMGGRNDVSLYSMNPDGTDVQLYYGAHSHQSGTNFNADVHFSKPRQMADGRVLSIFRPFVTNFGGGDVVFINGNDYADKTQPIWSQQGFISGTAETVFKQNVVNGVGLPLKGRYNAIFPMLDGSSRYLMSWSQCQILSDPLDPASRIIPCTLATAAQLNDPNLVEAPPSYGVFLVDADSNTQVPLIKPEVDTVYSEVVMAYATTVPPIIFDRVAGVSADIDANFAAEAVGVLHIRSVYDFDNAFSAYGAILPTTDDDNVPITIDTPAEMANPKNTLADERPARFIRITKKVSFPDPISGNDSLSNTAFGRSTQQGMREIIGYAPVEPDGSIKIKVPADVPLTISVLDKDGRRISNRHQSWFQVKAGATLECVGCHVHNTADQANNKPHGRPNYASTFNPGSETTGIGFPNSLDSMWAEIGETMAETRARQSCLPSNATPCADLKPSTDLEYSDVWTDDVAANRSADVSFKIDYADTPVSPIALVPATFAATACNNTLYDNSLSSFTYCRIIINYQQHIQPIWEKARGVADADTCTGCHTTNGNTQVAPGQLELTNAASSDEPDHLVAYRELLFDDNQQEFNGNLVDVSVDTGNVVLDGNGDPVLDINGDPIPIFAPVTVSASMSTGGARVSYFMEKITNTELNAGRTISGTTDHSNMLTASELKLISEWLDIGAQYFNNPFELGVPVN